MRGIDGRPSPAHHPRRTVCFSDCRLLARAGSAWQTAGAVSPLRGEEQMFRSRLSTTKCGFGKVIVPNTAFCVPSCERRGRLPSSLPLYSRLSAVRADRRRTLRVCLVAQFVRAARERICESGASRSASGVLAPLPIFSAGSSPRWTRRYTVARLTPQRSASSSAFNSLSVASVAVVVFVTLR
jgi:hypothetical protein